MKSLRSFLCALALFGALSPAAAATTQIPARPVRVLCKVIATSNLTLSGAQTIDSVSVVAGDVVCPVAQSDNKNAAYLVQAGAWKAVDPGVGTGLEFYALRGSSNVNKVYGCDTTGAITWGSTSTTFTLKSSSGAAFNPASPGAIGGTTPADGTFNILTANTDIVLPSAAVPSATTGTIKLFSPNGGTLGMLDFAGNRLSFRNDSATGTAQILEHYLSVSLADDASSDFTLAGSALGGSGVVTAAGATTSVSCSFSFAANAATTDNGLTGTNCAVADTDTKLCAFASGGAVRIRNRLGSTQTVLIKITEYVRL